MCLRDRDLQESHIVPAWAYKRARDERFSNPNPIIVSEGVAVQHSKQHKEFLLCRDCEREFGQREDYVARISFQRDERAPFLDLIGNVVLAHERMRLALPGKLDLAALVYFGASVIWRASISSQITRCSLGPKYDERFRAYLNHEAPFPETAVACVCFHDLPIGDAHVAAVTTTPVTQRQQRYHLTHFPIWGLQYYFAIGARVDPVWRGFCAVRGAPAGILLIPQIDLLDWFGPIVRSARTVGTVAKLKAP